MIRIRFDDVLRTLPALDELRPVLDYLLAGSLPDPARRWTGSGELDGAGARLVDPETLEAAGTKVADQEHEHLGRVYHAVLEAVACLSEDDPDGAARALLAAAALEEARNRPERAEAYAASAAAVARSGRDPRLTATALRRQARATRALGHLPEAETLYAAGYEIAKGAADRRGAAEGAIGAGNVLEDQGRWPAAEGWYREAIALLESESRPAPEQWHAWVNLHVVARSQGKLEESVEPLRRAEEIAVALDDRSAPPILLNARGQLEMARGAFDDATERFREALAASSAARAKVIIRLNLGEALFALGRTLEAAEEVREAEREALAAGVTTKLPEVYRLLGRIAYARGNGEGFVLFERALEVSRERHLPPLEEALTLDAYASSLRRPEDSGRADELRSRAAEIFRRLGIAGSREQWADSFGVATDLPEGRTFPAHGADDEGGARS